MWDAVLVSLALTATSLPASAAAAAPAAGQTPLPAAEVPLAQRNTLLGKGWANSGDRAWTTAGDADGFHVLVADAANGYAWRTATTLAEPGFEVDQWIGNACLTASGQRLVVTYAPRSFTNEEEMSARGGFVAVVDLTSGAVTKPKVRGTLAYFSPGCGAGESAVVTQSITGERERTRVIALDAATGAVAAPVEVPGQLTSAVPTKDGIIAADSHSLVRVAGDGRRTLFAPAASTPFNLVPDADGGVVFQDLSADRAFVRRAAGSGQPATLASGAISKISVEAGSGGRVFLTGAAEQVTGLPGSVRKLDVPAGAEPSTHGELALIRVSAPAPADHVSARALRLEARSTGPGKDLAFQVHPAGAVADKAGNGRAARSTPGQQQARGSGDAVDADRWCSVPRGSLRDQAVQPKPRQIEWAVDQAVRSSLTLRREANWKGLGMPAYSPQSLFPLPPLEGGGAIPAQIALGIAAQESNMWQATGAAMPGVTANPLIGNFYGRAIYDDNKGDDWDIHWDKADCGYGVTQMTDGMRLAGKEKPGETALPYETQRAVALDFAANVAAGVRLLGQKWNETRKAGLTVNGGDPKHIENWFFAVWAYNSGFYANKGDGSPWGLGWLNNPANPRYKPDRPPFLEYSYDDARHPQDWPYPEKVIGWAGHPLNTFEAPDKPVAGYRQAWWVDAQYRELAKPPRYLFCDQSNQCEPGKGHVPNYPGNPPGGKDDVRGEPAGPCAHKTDGYFDLKCWYHEPVSWKECPKMCGNELLRFDPGYAYQDDGASYPPNCRADGLPAGAIVVDNTRATSIRPDCGRPWQDSGDFTLDFASGSAKVDIHQLGAGFGGHFWFAHTRGNDAEGAKLGVTGTWNAGRAVHGWARVLVHLPDHGAHTQQAQYLIDRGSGEFDRRRVLSQGVEANRWVSAGVYQFAGVPRVRLANYTLDGRGTDDIAWDAIAIQPLPGKPQHVVAALGDSYSSGEGMGGYATESDDNHGNPRWNACRRSASAWPRVMTLPGATAPTGQLSDQFSTSTELGFVACSGAKTTNLTGWRPNSWDHPGEYQDGEGQFHEISQLASGVLDENTTLVTMTIGGNDNDAYSSALRECAAGSCWDEAFLVKYRAKIDQNIARTKELLRKVRTAPLAVNARILLVGYPKLVSTAKGCGLGGFLIDPRDAGQLESLASYMAEQQYQAVQQLKAEGARIDYVRVKDVFDRHAACDDQEWINGFSKGPRGGGDFHAGDKASLLCWPWENGSCLSRESFHPNQQGGREYARAVEELLRTTGYSGNK
ncbi:SGNH/GDSL hydrolase family protein [Crossiella sp. CA-258035]|uniref:SGNH/GDSL hydrolase family protein n=1 Tax=Crossiella sp. CA-258035 TaxID=2981138 RepID=UPI0024BC6553|nr:SGNH/GDSL hydrolase family protein [Crossiella sp. CA-258035]WHT22587.1 SGNH/GDSL hydrolase family protein [Crossiella sp. CA-258035]